MRTFQFIVYKKLLGVFLLCDHFNSLFTRSYQVCFFYANISIHCLQEVIRRVSSMRTFQFIVYKKLLGVFLLCEHFNSLFTRSYANISIHCLQEVIMCFLLCEHFNSLFTRSYQVCFFYANISIHCLQEVIRCVSFMRTFQFIVYKKLLGVFLLCDHFNSLFTRSYQVCFFYANISIHCLQEVIRCVSSMRTFQFIVYKKLLGVFLLCELFNSLFTRSYQVCFFYANISIHCLQEVIRCVSSMRTFQFTVYKKLFGVFLLCEHFNSLFTRSNQVYFFYANISIHCLQEVIRCLSSMRTFQFIVYKKLLGVFLLCEHFNSLFTRNYWVCHARKKLLGVFLLCEHFNSLFTRSYQVCFFYANISIHCLQEVVCFFYANISIHCLQEVITCVSSMRTFQFIVYKKLLGVFLLCEHFNSLFTRSYQVCFFYANISIHCLQEVIRRVSSMRTFQFIVYKKLLGVFLLCEHFNSLFTRSYQVSFFYAIISIHCLQEVIRCVSFMRTFQFIVYKKLLDVLLLFSIHCLQEVIRCVSSMRTFQFIVYKKLLGVFLLCEHFNSLFTRSYQVCFFYANFSIHCLQEVIRCVSSMRTFQFIVYKKFRCVSSMRTFQFTVYKKLFGVFLLCEHFNSLFTRSNQVYFFYANISIHCLQEVIRCLSSMRTFQFIVYKKLLGVFLLCEHFNSLFTRNYWVCSFYATISIHCLQEVIRCVSSMRTFQFIVYKKLLGVFLLCEHFNSLFTRSYQVYFFYANISIHCLQEVVCFFYANISIHCLQEVITCVSSMRTFQFIVYKKLLGVFLLCEHFISLFTRSYQVCFFYAKMSIDCLQEVIRCVSSMRTFQFIVYKKLLGVFLLCEHFNSLFTRSYQVCFFYANISIHCLQEVIRCVSSMRTFQFIVYKKLLGVFLLCEHFNSLFTRSYQVCFFYANISIHCLQEVIRCVSSMRTFQFTVNYSACFFYCLQEVIRCVSSMRTFQFIVYKKLLGVFLLCEHFNSLFTRSLGVFLLCEHFNSLFTRSFLFLLCEHFNSLFTRSNQVYFFYANISIHCLQEVIRCLSSMRTFQFIVYKKLLGVFLSSMRNYWVCSFQFIVYKKLLGVFLLCEHFNSLFTRSYQACFFYANISIHCLQEVIRCISSMRTFLSLFTRSCVFLLCEHFNSLFTRSYQVCFFYANISIHCLQEVIRCVSSMRTFNSLFTRSYQVCFFYAKMSIDCLQEVIRCVSSMRTFQFIVYKK